MNKKFVSVIITVSLAVVIIGAALFVMQQDKAGDSLKENTKEMKIKNTTASKTTQPDTKQIDEGLATVTKSNDLNKTDSNFLAWKQIEDKVRQKVINHPTFDDLGGIPSTYRFTGPMSTDYRHIVSEDTGEVGVPIHGYYGCFKSQNQTFVAEYWDRSAASEPEFHIMEPQEKRWHKCK